MCGDYDIYYTDKRNYGCTYISFPLRRYDLLEEAAVGHNTVSYEGKFMLYISKLLRCNNIAIIDDATTQICSVRWLRHINLGFYKAP